MDKAIIYARVSSKDQENEGFSIPAQVKLLKEYALKNNFIIVREFIDVETAKKAGRTQFNEMLKLFEENKNVNHILVEKTDRLLRNLFDHALLGDLVEKQDIKVHLVKENVILTKDSKSNEKLIFGIKVLLSKNFIDNLSEEVKKGMTEKASQGIYPSKAPYGYFNIRENGRSIIKVDPQSAPFIKKMFELYATGSYSLLSLRKKMVAEGMIYRNGKNFHKSSVETILKNPIYRGVFRWKGKIYENASHEAIISRELFDQVQDILINPSKGKSRKGLFPYTNVITCGVCGCSLTAEIKKEKYIYYHCTGFKGNCEQPYLRQEVLEEQFEKLLQSMHISDSVQALILKGVREGFADKIEYHNNLVQTLEKQIKLLQTRIDQIYLDKLDGKISEAFWQMHSQRWIEEKDELVIKLSATQRADSHFLKDVDLILELAKKAVTLFEKQNVTQKRRLLILLLSNCTYKSGKLDLKLKEPFAMIMESSKAGKWCARQDSNL